MLIGLGNIGPEYDGTRHNIGFEVVDALAKKYNASFTLQRLAQHAEFTWKGRPVHLIKPTTYMNLSGKAVSYWVKQEKIAPENWVVITDDIALPVGKLRLKKQGSHGGHNGLRDIESVFGSSQYNRLRFGVGNDFPKGKQADFVLGRFSTEDHLVVEAKIAKSIDLLESFIWQGVDKTMNFFNE